MGKLRIMTEKEFHQKAYALYQLRWMMENGILLEEINDAVREASSIHMNFVKYLEEYGFDGKLWLSYEKFMEEVYMDEDYMSGMLCGLKDGNLFLADYYTAFSLTDSERRSLVDGVELAMDWNMSVTAEEKRCYTILQHFLRGKENEPA